jgi:hypothetical protein
MSVPWPACRVVVCGDVSLSAAKPCGNSRNYRSNSSNYAGAGCREWWVVSPCIPPHPIS